jgi:AraC-like DNA-binding protein
MMNHSADIIPGCIVYAQHAEKEREKDGFFAESVLAYQISGQLTLETSSQKVTTKPGEVLLMRKHQLVKMTKTPLNGDDYKIIFILLSETVLRKYALENQLDVKGPYKGKPNIFIPKNEFIHGFFQSLIPYKDKPKTGTTNKLGVLKVKEAAELLLYVMPGLNAFLFDFSEPHKMDLEKFMLSNFHFNVPVEKFAQLTGRSLAGFKRDFQKTFGAPPRQWLQDKRLTEARYQIEKNNKKPSAIYLDLGFESLSHFSTAFKQKFGVAPTELL